MKPREIRLNDGISGHEFSGWFASKWKRIFDLLLVAPALVVLSPLLGIIALLIKCTSKGPVFFRQRRVGRGNLEFTIYKFRTMCAGGPQCGPRVTREFDPRVTRIGRVLRATKLDELPQLWNVFRGDMSLVGPRPLVREHQVYELPCRPGITGAATLAFCDEERMLRPVPDWMLDQFQVSVLAPTKMDIDIDYMRDASLLTDVRLILATLVRGLRKQEMSRYVQYHLRFRKTLREAGLQAAGD